MESLATIASGFYSLTIVAKLSILDVCGSSGYASATSQENSQPAIPCTKLTIETLEQCVKYVKSWQ